MWGLHVISLSSFQVIAGSMVGLAVAVGSYLTSKAWV